MKKGKIVLTLFYTMLKIGLFTFGGGYGMIALLENEFVSKRKWLSKEEFLDMIAIAESSPGPIAINSSTYIGYKMAKFWGSLAATVAVCIPSFVIIFVISLFLDAFLSFEYVAYAFRGIQVGVAFLIFTAGLKMLKDIKRKPLPIIILSVTAILMISFSLFAVKFSSIYYILISGVVGLFSYHLCNIIAKRKLAKQTQNMQVENSKLNQDKITENKETLSSISKEIENDSEKIEDLFERLDEVETLPKTEPKVEEPKPEIRNAEVKKQDENKISTKKPPKKKEGKK